jgi:hypothetical protein
VQRDDEPPSKFAQRKFLTMECDAAWRKIARAPQPPPDEPVKWQRHPLLLELPTVQRLQLIALINSPALNQTIAKTTGIAIDVINTVRLRRQTERKHWLERCRVYRAYQEQLAGGPAKPVVKIQPIILAKPPTNGPELFLFRLSKWHHIGPGAPGPGEPTRETIGLWARPPLPRRVISVSLPLILSPSEAEAKLTEKRAAA